MTDLEKLKLLTDETDAPASLPPESCPCGSAGEALASPRLYTDEQLEKLLELHQGDVYAAAYAVCLRKAENTGASLPGGIQLGDQSAYWRRRAAMARRSQSHNAPRADEAKPLKGGAL